MNQLQSPSSQTPNQRAWRRLRRNKPAMGGLLLIVLAVIIAILGYLIAPDQTPNANDQVAELPLRDPGFSTKALLVHRNLMIPQSPWWATIWYGQLNPYKLIPITDHQFIGDSIRVALYQAGLGLDESADWQTFHLADVVYPLSNKNAIRNVSEGEYAISLVDGQTKQESSNALQQIINTANLTERTFPLGTDRFGRSVLARLIIGVRVSLLVGLIAVLISLTIGIFLGILAGYFGSWVDDLIMWLINTVWSIPTLLLVFAIVLALGRGVGIIFLAVGLTMWVEVARIVRGQIMSLRTTAFVEAARSMGFGHWRIMFRHMLPNVLGPVMVIAAANFATAILVEAGLSYLGFGIQPPQPSWGTMLNENYGYAISGQPMLALAPAVAIMLLVLAFNLLGNGLRDALDVKK